MTVHIKVKPHTIFFMMGFSQCGMTTFAKALHEELSFLMLQRAGIDHASAYLSQEAEAYRLNPDLIKGSFRHSELKNSAVEAILKQIDTLTEHSVNKEFVVVDSNFVVDDLFLIKDIEEGIKSKGYKSHFIIFDHDDFPDNEDNKTERRFFKKRIPSQLTADTLDNATFIRKLPAVNWSEDLKVEIEDLKVYYRCMLPLGSDRRVAIIGDTHEHVDALKHMLSELKNRWPGIIPILVGDYLDKGGQTAEMVKFIKEFVDAGGKLVHGNHEYSNYRRILAQRAGEEIPPNEHLTASPVLLSNPELADIVVDIYENHSTPFLKVFGDNCSTIYVTHAPCKERYIGKLHNKALQKQRNVAGDRSKDYRLSYEQAFKEADEWKPVHVFGHISHGSNEIEYKNKIFLDTGAVYGYHLTSVIMDGKGNRSVVQFKTESLVKKSLPDNLHLPL